MGDEQNGHGLSRLDRMEGLMELLINDHLRFQDEHKSLLTSQILLTDQVGKMAGAMDTMAGAMDTMAGAMDTMAGTMKALDEKMLQLAESQKELSEAQKHTDERMNALIAVVDDLVRKRLQ